MAERARVVDVRGGELQLLRQVRREPDDPREEALDVARQRLDLGRLLEHVGQRVELADEVRLRRRAALLELDALEALTRMRSVPSGTLIILWITATVPTS